MAEMERFFGPVMEGFYDGESCEAWVCGLGLEVLGYDDAGECFGWGDGDSC